MGPDYGLLLLLCGAVLVSIGWALAPVRVDLCICCTEQDATRPAPDGGSGGVCDDCDEALR